VVLKCVPHLHDVKSHLDDDDDDDEDEDDERLMRYCHPSSASENSVISAELEVV